MREELNTELFKAIKLLKTANLTNDDKDDLLSIFNNTNNVAIRDQIALIFAEVHYNKAIPFIINKINDKKSFNHTGTLVYCLLELDSKDYFTDLIKIMCEQAYESKIVAHSAIKNLIHLIDADTSLRALSLLKNNKKELQEKGLNDNDTVDLIDSIIGTIEARK